MQIYSAEPQSGTKKQGENYTSVIKTVVKGHFCPGFKKRSLLYGKRQFCLTMFGQFWKPLKRHSCHQIGLKRTLLSALKKKGHFCTEKDNSIFQKTLLSKIYFHSDWCYKIMLKKTLLLENITQILNCIFNSPCDLNQVCRELTPLS